MKVCDCCCPLPQLHSPLGAGTLRWTTGQVWSLVWWLTDRGWPWRRGVPCAVASSAPQPWPSFIASRGGAPHGPPERMEDLRMGSSPSSWMFIPYTLPSLTPSQAPSPVGLVILFFFFFCPVSCCYCVSQGTDGRVCHPHAPPPETSQSHNSVPKPLQMHDGCST